MEHNPTIMVCIVQLNLDMPFMFLMRNVSGRAMLASRAMIPDLTVPLLYQTKGVCGWSRYKKQQLLILLTLDLKECIEL